MASIARHYTVPGLLGRILEALQRQGKDIARLQQSDLSPVDEFHIRGREATAELAELAGIRRASHVIDVGSGLGGAARFLAAKFACRVTGIDLTREYCEVAAALSKLVPAGGARTFCCANALTTPFRDSTFDVAISQHVQMNVKDKPALYRELYRVLRPGGRFVFHDILAGPSGPPHFPVPWAEDASLSFLIDAYGFRELLENTGFRVLAWRDVTDVSREWLLAALERRKSEGPPEIGIHLLMGETAPAKFDNVGRSLMEGRITIHQGVVEKR